MSLLAPAIPLSLYIHLPWCIEKCPYCDFNSHQLSGELNEQQYINALLKDLEQDLPKIWGRTVESIFIGGGTPSLFSGAAIDELLSQGLLKKSPIKDSVAAVSSGIVKGQPLLDLDYVEDSSASVDMNFVMTGDGRFVEVQGTAEEEPFNDAEFDALRNLARLGCKQLTQLQQEARNQA